MIEIKKQGDKSYQLKIEEVNFLINPARLTSGSYIILTHNDFTLNKDTIFQAPGEYEVQGVYFYGFPDHTFLFQNSDYSLIFTEKQPSKDTLQQIKSKNSAPLIVFMPKLDDLNFWHKEFESKVFITESKIKAKGFEIEETKTVKINPRRINHTIYILV